ncbi:hypothetical protein GOBAR_DD06307 [Gossypium barbadense]|nr:hypothetical protein GOBAR_DD06307 [Gossypium barbadense]
MNPMLNIEHSLDIKKAVTKIDDILVHPLVPEHEPMLKDHIETLIQTTIHQDTFGIVPIDIVDKFVLKNPVTRIVGFAEVEENEVVVTIVTIGLSAGLGTVPTRIDIELDDNVPLKKLSCRMACTKRPNAPLPPVAKKPSTKKDHVDPPSNEKYALLYKKDQTFLSTTCTNKYLLFSERNFTKEQNINERIFHDTWIHVILDKNNIIQSIVFVQPYFKEVIYEFYIC